MHGGQGRFFLPNQGETAVLPGDCVIVAPGVEHRYGGCGGEPYIEDAVRFIGPIADAFFKAGVIQNGVSHLGTIRKVLPIWESSRDPSLVAQIAANVALQNLLLEIYRQNQQLNEKFAVVQKIIIELKNDISRWWTVEELADRISLPAYKLRNVFFEYTGTTPKNYIEQLKMKRAMEMLASPDASIKTTAKKLGYVDPYHFSRRFKHIAGVSPVAYKKRWHSSLDLADSFEKIEAKLSDSL